MTADPAAPVLLALSVILCAAKVGGHLASRTGNPPVLGELLAGVVLANVAGAPFRALAELPAIDILARLGVVVLLFEVGLESTVRDMLKVGFASFMVALLGVVGPFALGWLVSAALLPIAGPMVHAFLGATLTATSVGITARVLKDLGRAQDPETRVILGAAVIDDVLGLVLLSVVSGVAVSGTFEAASVGWIVTKAFGCLASALLIGAWVTPPLFRLAARLDGGGVLLALALSFACLLAWATSQVGLSPIVGAYAAGLLLERAHFVDFSARGEEHDLEELVKPLSATLAPVFFVLMGTHVELAQLARPDVLGLALALTVVAIAGKFLCALAVPAGLDRLTVGIGMVPRGEVGLIFAAVGRDLTVGDAPLVGPAVFSAIVVMAILTTLVTPPALAWRLKRRGTSTPSPTPSV